MNVYEDDVELKFLHILHGVIIPADVFHRNSLIFKCHGHNFVDGGLSSATSIFAIYGKDSFLLLDRQPAG